jgi:hypothetical protein
MKMNRVQFQDGLTWTRITKIAAAWLPTPTPSLVTIEQKLAEEGSKFVMRDQRQYV